MAYKWFDRARRIQGETGEPHPLFSNKVFNQQACFVSHDYAKELTVKALDTLAEAAQLQMDGRPQEAEARLEAGRKQFENAIQWWDATVSEWARQHDRFPDDTNAVEFGNGAKDAQQMASRLIDRLTPQVLRNEPKVFLVRVNSALREDRLVRAMAYRIEPPEAFARP
jgi:hypothetical protein